VNVGGLTVPDLRNRFIVGSGAGATYPVGSTGGSMTTTLGTANIPSHTHSIGADGSHGHKLYISTGGGVITGTPNPIPTIPTSACAGCNANFEFDVGAAPAHAHGGATGSVGSGTAFNTAPPYYALAFIMKL
jgi:microcystin-dependent protein